MYALVEIKGKQFKAEKGATLQVDLLDAEDGTKLEFADVLLVSEETGVKVTVSGKTRGDKVISYKYKRRKSYHKTVGHRQPYTLVKVEDILVG